MKTNKQVPSDETLRASLRQWTVSSPLPPRFQDRVWQRIEQAEPKPGVNLWESLRTWLEGKITRPTFALSYVTALLVLGLTAGYWQARVSKSQTESVWQARYVQSVDPFQPARR